MARKRSRKRGSDGGVSRRAVLGVILAGGAGIVGAQETGAFSSVTGDRGFSVGTAADDAALLGIEPQDPEGTDGDTVALFTLTNRFDEPLTVDRVTVASSGALGIGRGDLSVPNTPLAPGQERDIGVTLSCESSATDDVELAVEISTDGESVELVRSTTVSCEAASGACSGPREVFDQPVDGDIDSENTVVIAEGVKVSGDVEAADCVILEHKAEIDGSATAGTNVSLGSKAVIKGDADAGGTVSLGSEASVKGDVGAGGAVSLGSEASIKGAVDADGSVSLGSKASVDGDVDAGGAVSLGSEGSVKGDVGAWGAVSLSPKASIKGAVDTDGGVSLGSEASIDGDVGAGGDVSLDSKAVIKGDVDAGGSVSVAQGATIKGDVSERD